MHYIWYCIWGMHDLLDWKFYKHLSLILRKLFDKVIGLLWFLKMLYHWFCCLRYVSQVTFKYSNKLFKFIILTCELFLLFYSCIVTIVIIQWLSSWILSTCGPNEAPGRKHNLPVGLMKLLVETQLTCGPNEAPGRNKDVWSFTCGPNEALGRNTTYLWA